MKAIQYTAFGNSAVIQLNQVDKPTYQENEVLVKIAATTINPFDMKVRAGYLQQVMPVQLPYTPGSDMCGTVEAAGSKVMRLKAGDEVYGTAFGGTYAEYIAVNENQVAVKPNNISAGEAAALAVPLVTAYSVLIETMQLQAGQKILIHAAGGGVGSIMVQLAKTLGAYIIATASAKEAARVKTLGADEVIDYKAQDFTQLVKDADAVADLVGGETLTKSFGVLKKGGKLVSIVMPPPPGLAEKYGVAAQFISSGPSYQKLEYGKQLVEQGKIKPGIAKTLKLEQAAEAQDMVSAGGIGGKVVLEIH